MLNYLCLYILHYYICVRHLIYWRINSSEEKCPHQYSLSSGCFFVKFNRKAFVDLKANSKICQMSQYSLFTFTFDCVRAYSILGNFINQTVVSFKQSNECLEKNMLGKVNCSEV